MAAAALMSAACFTACSNEEVLPEAVQETASTCPKVIYVNFEKPAETRLVMGDNNTPVWEQYSYDASTGFMEGDYICVFGCSSDGELIKGYYNCIDPEKNEFEYDEDYPWCYLKTGDHFGATPEGPFMLLYSGIPGSCDLNLEEGWIRLYDPNYISPTPNDLNGGFMVGTTDDLSKGATMKNIFALLKFTIPAASESENIPETTWVCITTATTSSAIYHWNAAPGTNPWSDWAERDPYCSSCVDIGNPCYDPDAGESEEDVQSLEPGDYYVPIIPQTLEDSNSCGSICLEYSKDKENAFNGFSMERKTKTTAVTLEAGKIYDLGTLWMDAPTHN